MMFNIGLNKDARKRRLAAASPAVKRIEPKIWNQK
jgi:hypothetical protein